MYPYKATTSDVSPSPIRVGVQRTNLTQKLPSWASSTEGDTCSLFPHKLHFWGDKTLHKQAIERHYEPGLSLDELDTRVKNELGDQYHFSTFDSVRRKDLGVTAKNGKLSQKEGFTPIISNLSIKTMDTGRGNVSPSQLAYTATSMSGAGNNLIPAVSGNYQDMHVPDLGNLSQMSGFGDLFNTPDFNSPNFHSSSPLTMFPDANFNSKQSPLSELRPTLPVVSNQQGAFTHPTLIPKSQPPLVSSAFPGAILPTPVQQQLDRAASSRSSLEHLPTVNEADLRNSNLESPFENSTHVSPRSVSEQRPKIRKKPLIVTDDIKVEFDKYVAVRSSYETSILVTQLSRKFQRNFNSGHVNSARKRNAKKAELTDASPATVSKVSQVDSPGLSSEHKDLRKSPVQSVKGVKRKGSRSSIDTAKTGDTVNSDFIEHGLNEESRPDRLKRYAYRDTVKDLINKFQALKSKYPLDKNLRSQMPRANRPKSSFTIEDLNSVRAIANDETDTPDSETRKFFNKNVGGRIKKLLKREGKLPKSKKIKR